MQWSQWRRMWVFVFFDLPVDTKEARREYTRFRKELVREGFLRMQYSVYVRPCLSEENAKVHDKRVRRMLPPEGEVRIIHLTDAQFGKMKIFRGKKRAPVEQMPKQLELF